MNIEDKLNHLILFRPLKVDLIHEEPLQLFYHWLKQPTEYEVAFIHSLLSFKERFSIDGQLFQAYITLLLAYHENPYTLALERKENTSSSFEKLVFHDYECLFELFHFDFNKLDPMLLNVFNHHETTNLTMDNQVKELLSSLCLQLANTTTVEAFYQVLKTHYLTYGVGFYGLNKAFRFDNGKLLPISLVANYTLKDIVGYDLQKEKLVNNTKAFLIGEKANNVLLYGDSGTGKSTSIKAILNDFYKDGLRIVEVYKHQFEFLPFIIHTLQNRHYKFIIYMDDLSFEDFEIEYKYLKSVIEGGLEEKPNNILIYATSNRRHLIKQTWSERQNIDEVSLNDALQEKMSLVNRFGISILFSRPAKEEYLEIVDALALKYGLDMDTETLHSQAMAWEIRNGGFSGRTAQQFIQFLLNKKALEFSL